MVGQISDRAGETGSLGKLDVGALAAWKRLRCDTKPMGELMARSDSEVRQHTAQAGKAARDESISVAEAARQARLALSPLPYFRTGDAIASAVCFVAAPRPMAVYDRRAHRGLELVGLSLSNRPGRYGLYTGLLEDCRRELPEAGQDWSARDVDLALFRLGGTKSDHDHGETVRSVTGSPAINRSRLPALPPFTATASIPYEST